MKKDEITHKARIIGIDAEFTTVEVIVSSACSACHAKGLCGFSEDEEKILMVPTDPYSDYKVGDEVTVHLRKTLGLKAVWLCYVVPLIILLTFILIFSGILGREWVVGLISLGAVALYYFVIWLFRDRLAKEYMFEIK